MSERRQGATKDQSCIRFLQWALPRLRMRWQGFRRVRRQVCHRLERRRAALELADLDAYRRYLEEHPAEWQVAAYCCRVTISRFYRDRAVFEALASSVLPRQAAAVASRGGGAIRCLSIGCASGEEPYTLALLCRFSAALRAAGLGWEVLAIDIDPVLLARAKQGAYSPSSLRELPQDYRQAFSPIEGGRLLVLDRTTRRGVVFLEHDIRQPLPAGSYDLICCRNLVFTYFDDALQREILGRLTDSLGRDGVLVLGSHERLPAGVSGYEQLDTIPIFQRKTTAEGG